jgi:hypothetical protein
MKSELIHIIHQLTQEGAHLREEDAGLWDLYSGARRKSTEMFLDEYFYIS